MRLLPVVNEFLRPKRHHTIVKGKAFKLSIALFCFNLFAISLFIKGIIRRLQM